MICLLIRDPSFRIRLRISKSHSNFQSRGIGVADDFMQFHFIAMWPSITIEPGSLVISKGVDDKRVALPTRRCPPVPTRVDVIFGNLAPIGPDFANLAALVKNLH